MSETLESRYASSPALLDFYRRKLPRAGWAGATDATERAFIRMTRREAGKGRRGRPFGSETTHAPVAAQSAAESTLRGEHGS